MTQRKPPTAKAFIYSSNILFSVFYGYCMTDSGNGAALLGAEDTVTSPTFALVNQYEGQECRIYHFDFYRIDSIEEVFDLGYEEYFYSGDLCLVEWPEKIEALIPDDVMTVKIEVEDDEERVFTID